MKTYQIEIPDRITMSNKEIKNLVLLKFYKDDIFFNMKRGKV
jgi:hypothetical protein